ncbi:hypothetical protein ACTXL6_16510 [Brachybacterium tyrofermentans]|uniref:hypothetical protein n=1 Tax=Brachybacterium tyrofermentans TaxID=47848 RepID=UPI003FD621E1
MTRQPLGLSPNHTDTAVLITPAGRRQEPRWALVSRGSAAAVIHDEHQYQRARDRKLVRHGLILLAGATLLLTVLSVLHGLGYDIPYFLPAVIILGAAFLLYLAIVKASDESPTPDDYPQLRRLLASPDTLASCSVDVARRLSPSQRNALTVAHSYGLTQEVLGLLEERVHAPQREKKQRAKEERREQALAIVDEQRASAPTYRTFS